MTIRQNIRALAVASALALTILSAPVLPTYAMSVPFCAPACGTKWCFIGQNAYEGGSQVRIKGKDGKVRVLVCNGFTGEWFEARTNTDSGPAAPLPTEAAP